jgi:hypothetical protein
MKTEKSGDQNGKVAEKAVIDRLYSYSSSNNRKL